MTMKQNIFTKQFEELTADELLHLMNMISEECDSHICCEECNLLECCVNKSDIPSGWFAPSIKEIVEAFREENR